MPGGQDHGPGAQEPLAGLDAPQPPVCRALGPARLPLCPCSPPSARSEQGGCRAVPGTITLGSGSSGTDRRVSCRQYPKKVLERFSLRSLLRSSPSAVRGAGFGVGGASVLQRDRGW